MTDESPEYTNLFGDILKPGYSFIKMTIENQFPGVFNWSMTYHSSSDVPVPYGRVVPGPSIERKVPGQGIGKEEGVRNYHGEKRRGLVLLDVSYFSEMQNFKKCKMQIR